MTPAAPLIEVLRDRDMLTRRAAEVVVEAAERAVSASGRFTVSLAGGGTPAPVYQLLATPACADRVAWAHTHVCWGDERCVPPTDPASNYRMAHDALLSHVPIRAEHVHRMRGELDPLEGAAAYDRELRRVFPDAAAPDRPPRFDLVLLGLGSDGHTASLFPGCSAIHERDRWVVAEHVPPVSMWRVTLTPVVLNAAREIVFVVSGTKKAEAVAHVLEGPRDPARWPAQVVAPPEGRVRWLVDVPAAGGLRGARPRPLPG